VQRVPREELLDPEIKQRFEAFGEAVKSRLNEKRMSMALECFCLVESLAMPAAVLLRRTNARLTSCE
jgi:hypothetical protein